MNHIIELIQQNGDLFYLITFIWTALEGETFVIFAGLAAQRELLRIDLLFLCAALGSMFGDQVFFLLGRFFGRRIVHHFPRLVPKLEKVFGLLEKHAVPFVLTYRFMYGVRNISALAIGMSQLPWRRYFFLNTIASFLWSLVFCGAGYLFGDVMERLGIGDEQTVNIEVRGLMITVLALFVLVFVIRYFALKHHPDASAQGEDCAQASKDKAKSLDKKG